MRDREPPTYPVNLRLSGLPVLVIGAGRVALRKVRGLLSAGATVTVVAPRVHADLAALAGQERLELRQRTYRSSDIEGFRLVFVATGRPEVDELVVRDAAVAGLFVNVADVPQLCGFYLPAVVRRGHLQLSVNTDGQAPFLSRRLRQHLEQQFSADCEEWLEAAGRFREAVLNAALQPAAREALFERFFRQTWRQGDGPVIGPTIPDEDLWRRWIDEERRGGADG